MVKRTNCPCRGAECGSQHTLATACSSVSKGSSILIDLCGHGTEVQCPHDEPCSDVPSPAFTTTLCFQCSLLCSQCLLPAGKHSTIELSLQSLDFLSQENNLIRGSPQRCFHLDIQYSVRIVFYTHPSNSPVAKQESSLWACMRQLRAHRGVDLP